MELTFHREKVLGYIFALLYGIYCYIYTLDTSLLQLHTLSIVLRVVCLSGTVLVVIAQYLTHRYRPRILIMSVLLIVVSVLVAIMCDSEKMMFVALFVVGASTIDFRAIIKTSITASVLSLLTILGAIALGVIRDYIYVRGETGAQAHCLGFGYYSTFPYMMLFVMLMYLYLRDKRIKLIEILIWVAISFAIFEVTTVRLTFYLSIAVLALDLVVLKCWRRPIGNNRAIAVGTCVIFALGILFWAGIAYVYSKTKPDFLIELNHWMSGRIGLNARAFEEYPLTLFGQYIEMHGNSALHTTQNYFYIDSGFIRCTLEYGLVFTVLVVIMYSYSFYYAYKHNEKVMFIWILCIFVFSFINNAWMSIAYNPLILYFGTIFLNGEKMSWREYSQSKLVVRKVAKSG